MKELDFDKETMRIGKTCLTCWNEGLRSPTIRYKAAPKACVRCRARQNKEHYQRRTAE